MIHPQALSKLYGYNAEVINRQTQDMTHAESLLQLSFEGNCLNWLLGHLVSSRTRALQWVGEIPVWDDNTRDRYRNGSPPIKGEEPGVLRLEVLLADFNRSQARLLNGLSRMTYEDMCQPSTYQDNTIGDSLAYVQFHEAHHVGQIVYLGQLAGKPGAWITY